MSGNEPTSEDDSGLEPPTDDLLAGEYVLGVLSAEERSLLRARIERDPVFAGRVASWERHIGMLASGVEPVEVPPHVWHRVRERLGWTGAPARTGWWQSVNLWRAVAGLAVAAAIAAALVGRIPPTPIPSPSASLQPTAEPVTTLVRTDGMPGWLAAIDLSRGTLMLVPVPASASSRGQVPELWLIAPGAAPRALGLVSLQSAARITVPSELRAALKSGSILAVSLEPPGGAPHGAPTGPIIAKGAIRL